MSRTLLCIRSTLVSVDPLACQISMPVAGLTDDLHAATRRIIPKGTLSLIESLIAHHQSISIDVGAASGQPNVCDLAYSTFVRLFRSSWVEFTTRYIDASREQRLAPVRATDRVFARINSVLHSLHCLQSAVTLAPGTADEFELIPIDPVLVRMEFTVAQQTAMVVDAVIRGCREISGTTRMIDGSVHVDIVVTLEHEIRELMLCCARAEAQTYYAGDNTLTASVTLTGEDLPRVVGKHVIVRR